MARRLCVCTVIGTRPEAIKMAPVIAELARHDAQIRSRVYVTAQHRDLLDQALCLFGIVPAADLDLMRENQTPNEVMAHILKSLPAVFRAERPDWVLVQGDTTTVAATALAAFHAGIRVGHVEAGLRTYDKREPFPEEINRRIAGVIADLHFAPTRHTAENLLRERVPETCIRVTGNTVIDALRHISSLHFDDPEGLLTAIPRSSRLILVTAHRRENFGARLEGICMGLRELSERYGDRVVIAYPVHPNPNVRQPVEEMLGSRPGIHLLPPLDYLAMVHLMSRADLVMTDSGGLQEEAPGLNKPVLVLREQTERVEAVEAGTVKVIGTDRKRIVAEASKLLDDPDAYAAMASAANPYGDGHAAARIVAALLEAACGTQAA